MLYEAYTASDNWRMKVDRAERMAAQNWRYRHVQSKESKVVLAALTAVLGIFVR